MMENDERSLLSDLSRGVDDAFWSIWQQHQTRVADVCRRQMNGVTADADDAVGRALLAAHRKMPKYASSILNVEAWLTRLSCNVCFDIHRERCRAARVTVSVEADALDDGATLIASGESPEIECLAAEIGTKISAAIAELPPPLREAARLRFLEEESYPEMARKLSITEDNARKRVQQSRMLLKERLKRELQL